MPNIQITQELKEGKIRNSVITVSLKYKIMYGKGKLL